MIDRYREREREKERTGNLKKPFLKLNYWSSWLLFVGGDALLMDVPEFAVLFTLGMFCF